MRDDSGDTRSRLWLWMKRGRRAKQGYDWYDRIQWFTSLFKTKAEMSMAMASMGTVAAVGGMTAMDAVETRRMAAERPAIVETERTTQSSTVFTIEGHDKAGRRGVFDVVVAKKEFLWVRGSAEQIEREGRVLKGPEIAGELFDAEVTAALAGAREIIAVGAASQEGNAAEERARAGRRARMTADLAAAAVAPDMPVSVLNLGQYRDPCATCETGGTSWQRPFIVIAVKSLDPDTDVGEALADAMSGKTKLPSPTSYSTFEMTKIR